MAKQMQIIYNSLSNENWASVSQLTILEAIIKENRNAVNYKKLRLTGKKIIRFSNILTNMTLLRLPTLKSNVNFRTQNILSHNLIGKSLQKVLRYTIFVNYKNYCIA